LKERSAGIDARAARRRFERSARTYAEASRLEAEVAARMLERLDCMLGEGDRAHPILRFVLRLVWAGPPSLGQKLLAWFDKAATSLGATRTQLLTRVILPYLYPAWLTGFALAFARAVGEYGSVVFISGNMPMRTEISPLLIITKLEQYDYAGATAIAGVMLLISFTLLLAVNALQGWSSRKLAN